MSVWLTPDLKPIVGGTYFPPDDRYYGRPGFKTILTLIAEQWRTKQEEIENQGTKIMDALMKAVHASDSKDSTIPDSTSCASKLFELLDKSFDEELGGFGKAPKFPQPVNFGALFRVFYSDKDGEMGARALHMCLHTLTRMANGGIHDHISQGFHRYSTDRAWHVPHFEKMLYDQAQLAVAYCEAYQITKDSFFADVAKDIFQYVDRDLSHPAGGFYSAEDADSLPTALSEDKKEGAFCVWMWEELQELLAGGAVGKDGATLADVFCHYYGVKEGGNVDPMADPHDELKHQNILTVSSTVADTAAKYDMSVFDVSTALALCRHTLHQTRQLRPRPHLDDKMVAAWNGMMISACSVGGQTLADPSLTSRAVTVAHFLRQHMWVKDAGVLLRSCYTHEVDGVAQIPKPIEGFVDDYACVIRGLLDLYEACHDEQWLLWAQQLQEKQIELFWDEDDGGFFSSTLADPSIVLRIKEDQDGAEPSPNSVAALNLLRLAAMLNKPEWHQLAARMFCVFSYPLEKVPVAMPGMCSALHFYHSTPTQIIILGDHKATDTQTLVKTVHSTYQPNRVLLVTDGATSLGEGLGGVIKALEKLDGRATAFVCENFTCALPTNCPEKLKEMLSV